MKKLYIIVIVMLISFVGFIFAADFDISLTPITQNAISGTVVSFDISIVNNTGIDAYVVQNLPFWAKYKNSNIVPYNNPGLILGLSFDPIWHILSGQTINIHVENLTQARAFNTQDIKFDIVNDINLSFVYTSAVSKLEPIADVVVRKTLVGNEPKMPGDIVSYNIEVKNIGSKIATGISVVDRWPSSMLVLGSQFLVDGVVQVPTIYNGLAYNYNFVIGDLAPFATSNVEINGTLMSGMSVGSVFENNVFVNVDSKQYSTVNDNGSLSNVVRGFPDLNINVVQTSANPTSSGDHIGYLISYSNIGSEVTSGILLESTFSGDINFLSANPSPINYNTKHSVWNLSPLSPGQSGYIELTGLFLGNNFVGGKFSNVVHIETNNVENNYANNSKQSTGEMRYFSDVSLNLYANNLTVAARNINTGLQIDAVSGDIVQLDIVLNNNGNHLETGTITISNITGFVGYVGLHTWLFSLAAGVTQTISLSGLVGPQNFVSFSPAVLLNYNNVDINDDVSILEPLHCGDGIVTQNEICDINGQVGIILPGQQCVEVNGQCVLETKDITNTVCMDYTTVLGTGRQCMSVIVPYQNIDTSMCRSLTSPYGVIIVDEDTNRGDMNFTCNTVNNDIASEIKIDCGNGDIGIANGLSSFVYNCEYEYDRYNSSNNLYTVQCYVDGNATVDGCNDVIRVDEGFYGVCGDGTIDDGEECDLSGEEDEEDKIRRYLDSDENYRAGRYDNGKYYCEDCRIRKYETDEFVYQSPQCLGTNTTLSVMKDELMPFRWRLWDRDNMVLRDNYDCNDIDTDEDRTIIDKDTMRCTFAIYNGVDYLQANDDEINKFTVDCFEQEDSVFFDYFEDSYQVDFDKIAGKYVKSVKSLFDRKVDTYGEYKLVLEKVSYDYCDPDTQDWEKGRLYDGICEVDFALTRPYLMQISTFGLDPKATNASDFLKDFYDISGVSLIKSTNINDTMDVDYNNYNFDSSVLDQKQLFNDKYKSLAITVNNSFKIRGNETIGTLFGGAIVKKVPNKLIFFVDGDGTLVLKQLTKYFPGTPYTIYVEGMDVVVKGSVNTNGMIITDKKIYFDDNKTSGYCEDGGQKVQGIFIAQGGFDSNIKLRNMDMNDERCQWGSLYVRGVLIGDGLEKLVENRRSHLNDWFEVDDFSESKVKNERKNEIFDGAALLIEYNPDLWMFLPPGAESFTQTLDIYKK